MLFFPLPSVLQELLARKVALIDAALGQHLHHFGFGGDGGVVGAWHPASILALHASAAHQHVLNGVVEHMTHVKHARYIGRRDDHRVGHALVGFRMKELVVKPILIPFLLNGPRVVF